MWENASYKMFNMETKRKGDFSKIFHLKFIFKLRNELGDNINPTNEVEVINIYGYNN